MLLLFSFSSLAGETDNNPLQVHIDACEKNDYERCIGLGVGYMRSNYRGIPVSKDLQKSKYYFKKACEAGKAQGCNNLAMVYKTLKDKENMLKYLTQACDTLSYKDSCKYLSIFYSRGMKKEKFGFELKKDKEKVLMYARKGCELGSMQACYKVKKLDPNYFDKLPAHTLKNIELILLLKAHGDVSLSQILERYNHFKKEDNFYKVLSGIKLFGRTTYYMGTRGVDFLPGVNAVIDGTPKDVAKDIERLYGVKFTPKEGQTVYVSEVDKHHKIVIQAHHWKDTSYVIGAYIGP